MILFSSPALFMKLLKFLDRFPHPIQSKQVASYLSVNRANIKNNSELEIGKRREIRDKEV